MGYRKHLQDSSGKQFFYPKMKKRALILQNWWVILFISFCGIVYTHASYKKNEVIASLDVNLNVLSKEKEKLVMEKEALLLQINSQSDPAWIQLILMKGLGLVPEGQKKVYFNDLEE